MQFMSDLESSLTNPREGSERTRREIHSNLSPAIYSHHARKHLIPDIKVLPFTEVTHTDPLELAMDSSVRGGLVIDHLEAREFAKADGIRGIRRFNVFESGYGDRFFTGLFAGAVGRVVSQTLKQKGLIDDPLSLLDYGRMFQTGWFGNIANQMALTRPALLQREFEEAYKRGPLYMPNFESELKQPLLNIEAEPESGLHIATLSDSAKRFFRKELREATAKSVGCPVARTSFTASSKQAEFLAEHGHLGESSGYYVDQDHVSANGRVKLSRDVYTVIDDALWQWGDYVERYAKVLLERGCDPEGIVPSRADQVLLID